MDPDDRQCLIARSAVQPKKREKNCPGLLMRIEITWVDPCVLRNISFVSVVFVCVYWVATGPLTSLSSSESDVSQASSSPVACTERSAAACEGKKKDVSQATSHSTAVQLPALWTWVHWQKPMPVVRMTPRAGPFTSLLSHGMGTFLMRTHFARESFPPSLLSLSGVEWM